jgi:hypothetical protein
MSLIHILLTGNIRRTRIQASFSSDVSCTSEYKLTVSCKIQSLLIEDQLSPSILFSTSNKMAIIGTVAFRLTDKNQQLYRGSLICACTGKLKIFPSKVSLRVTLKITGYLKWCTEWYTKLRCSAIFSRSICYFFLSKYKNGERPIITKTIIIQI